MKKNLILLACLVVYISTVRSQADYIQFEAGYVKAKSGQAEMFEKGIAAHARKYHTADPYKMFVFSVLAGPHSGEYFVGLGPVTFTQIEGRPSSEEHDMDWSKNVTPYIESEGETYYWRMDKEIGYNAPNSDNFSRARIRNFTLMPGERDRFEGLLKQVAHMYKTKNYPASYHVYWKWGASQGPHVITEINVDHWSYFDRPDTFEKDFEEANGEGSFDRFLDDFERSVDLTKTFDELFEFQPKLSSE